MIGGRALEIGHRHVVKIRFGPQDTGAGVVDVQKTLQVAEGISRAQGLDAGVRQGHPIALREFKDQNTQIRADKWFEKIRATETKLNGRINNEIIILKIFK